MGIGISLVMSVFNRTKLFRLSYPTWFRGTDDSGKGYFKTPPDEIIILNDNGAPDLDEAVAEMEDDLEKWGIDIPVGYYYRSKGVSHWSNPAIPHNWLVKEAKGPVVLILDPEVAFVNDTLPFVRSYFFDEDYNGVYQDTIENRRRNSFSAGTCFSIQTEFMHAAEGLPVEQIPYSAHISENPASHQIIRRHGPAHEYRCWWKDRYIALGGKDERYKGWGYEDLDIEHRNMRFDPVGKSVCDHRIEIVTYGHGLQQLDQGEYSTGANEQLWRHKSPADGVANRDIEWGKIQ